MTTICDAEAEAEALFQLGNRQLESRAFVAAEANLRQAIERNPRSAQANAALGYLLHHVDARLTEAERFYRTALELAPGLVRAHMNLGALLLQQTRFSEAEAAYANALQLEPGRSDHWCNLGSLYVRAQREKDAETCLRKAIELDPDSRTARFNLSYLRLRHGLLDEGWALFESRDWYLRFERQFPCPRWQGEPLQGKSLLLCPEAGYGDVLQFVRYATLFKARGVRHLALACHAPLERLLRAMPELDAVVGYSAQMATTGYDYWMPLLSAPFYFDTTRARASGQGSAAGAPCQAVIPYLHADPALCAQWAPRLPTQGKRVGLVWRGNPEFEFDNFRSLPALQTLLPLWEVDGVSFVSLQKGVAEDQALDLAQQRPLLCLGHQMQDFADAAAIVSQLDLVITVDSAIAHLAGALGTPCWLLLPDYMTDWRWGVQGAQTHWYVHVLRLFRQGADRRWEPVVDAVRAALLDVVQDSRRATY